jgi:hypothetical protein
MDDAHAGVEYALQCAVRGADQAKIGDLFELKDFREKGRFAIDISNGEADGLHSPHRIAALLRVTEACGPFQQQGEESSSEEGSVCICDRSGQAGQIVARAYAKAPN